MHRIMGPQPPDEKQNYQQEAEDIRAKARDTRNAEARVQLLLIASLYEKLAEHLPIALQAKRSDDSRPEDPPECTDSA
jgi:hypothetical protein